MSPAEEDPCSDSFIYLLKSKKLFFEYFIFFDVFIYLLKIKIYF